MDIAREELLETKEKLVKAQKSEATFEHYRKQAESGKQLRE